MSKQSVKPVLLSEAQIQAIIKFRKSSASNQVSALRQLSMRSPEGWSIPRWPQFLLKQLQDCRSESNAFL